MLLLGTLFIPALALGETVTVVDLVEKGGRYYKKSAMEPYTGRVSGKIEGGLKEGRQEGSWSYFHENGQLWKRIPI